MGEPKREHAAESKDPYPKNTFTIRATLLKN